MIDKEDLGKTVSRELDRAETWRSGDMAGQQTTNLEYYHREPFGNEKKGFSKVVTADVMETIEGMMPDLMKIFTSGDNTVEFEPVGAEDVASAEQATDYLNHIFTTRLDGFSLLYDWFKDALLMKNGIIKVGWEDADQVEFHDFKGVTQEEIDLLEEEDSVEEIEVEEDEEGNFDVRVKRIIKGGKPFVETIPSEEFYIRERSKSIAEADFHAVVCERTVGEMLAQGFKEEDLVSSKQEAGVSGSTQVKNARFSSPAEGTTGSSSVGDEKEDELVEVVEAYIRMFDEDDKVMKLMRVLQVGHNVLESEEVNRSPFISLSPIMMPHKFTGVAVADLVRDVQEINSALWRQMLDNLTLSNAGRYAAVEGQANLKDLLDNKIGGIVRMKAQGAVQRLDTPNLSPFTIEALDRLQEKKELRVGVGKMTAGLDPNALTSHTGSQQLNQVMSAAQQKILLIARVFAETGVKDLFRYLYEEVRTHQTQEDIVKLRGKFVAVTPFDWIDRKDMTVTVGIGNGNKDQQAQLLQQIGQVLQQVGQTEAGYLITPQNVYNLTAEFITNAGYKNVDRYISNPETMPEPTPQPSPEMVEAQAEAAKDMADAQLKQVQAEIAKQQAANDAAKLQLDREKFEWQMKVEAAELTVEASQDRPVGIGKS